MTAIPRPRNVFVFCLTIWLAGLLLGPLLWYASPTFIDQHFWSFFKYYYMAVGIGALGSVLSFFALFGIMYYANKQTWSATRKKWIMAGLIVVLFVPVFAFVFDGWDELLDREIQVTLAAYFLPMFVTLLIFRWPHGIQYPTSTRPEKVEASSI